MEKFQKYGFVIMVFLIFILYLVSSTDLIFSEDADHEIYNISVIIDETTDHTWQNYKKGMEQAAMDYNVDVSFITLYSDESVEEQLDFIKREAQDGAEAIVLAAVDSTEVATGLEDMNALPHLVGVGTQLDSTKVAVSILSDGYELGEKLGNLIVMDLKTEDLDVPIHIFPGNTKQNSINHRLQGLLHILSKNGYEYQVEDVKMAESIKETMLRISAEEPRCLFVGLEPNLLSTMADHHSNILAAEHQRIYGVGYTNYILSSLEKGQLSGIVVENDYLKGYLSIEAAVSLIKHDRTEQEVTLETFVITPETVHDSKYEMLLYPIS